MTPGFGFRVVCTDGAARRAVLETPHGEVDLPTFMPVGTAGSVKTLTPDEVAETGARLVLGNTYHLMLRPGAERIAAAREPRLWQAGDPHAPDDPAAWHEGELLGEN